jgi:hypothetical protein
MEARLQQRMNIVRVLRVDNIKGFTIKTWNFESTTYKFSNHLTLLLLWDGKY